MSGLDAGALDREIVLQTATRSRDETTGEEVLTWDTEETIWAQWMPSSAREVWLARQINSEIAGMYRTYYRDDVYPDVSRIVGHDGRTYDIQGVTEEGRQDGILIAVAAHGEAA